MQTEYRYKLDFYYQQSLMYLLTLIAYAAVRGSFIEDSFTFVLKDPILYIILFFVVLSIAVLVLNKIRNRKLIVTETGIFFQHRFMKRELSLSDIEWIHIGKERLVQTAGRFQVIVIKLKGRRRSFRIRLGRYERDGELLEQMENIATKVPSRQHPRFRVRRKSRR